MALLSPQNFNTPAPRWFRISRKIINNTTNFVLALLAIKGYADNSSTLLIIKLVQSFAMDTLDSFMGNGEIYAPKQNN